MGRAQSWKDACSVELALSLVAIEHTWTGLTEDGQYMGKCHVTRVAPASLVKLPFRLVFWKLLTIMNVL